MSHCPRDIVKPSEQQQNIQPDHRYVCLGIRTSQLKLRASASRTRASIVTRGRRVDYLLRGVATGARFGIVIAVGIRVRGLWSSGSVQS